jgi:hypothetical protein
VIEIGKGRSRTGTKIRTRTRTPPRTCTSTESATNKAGTKEEVWRYGGGGRASNTTNIDEA